MRPFLEDLRDPELWRGVAALVALIVAVIALFSVLESGGLP